MNPQIISFIAFMLIAGLVYLVARRLAIGQRDSVSSRLVPADLPDLGQSGRGAVADAVAEALARQLPQFDKDSVGLDQELRRAGYYQPTARQDFLALRNVLVIVVVLFTGAIIALVGPKRPQVVLLLLICGMVTAALCWALPRIYVKLRGMQRVARIRRSLPDALDMLSMCLTGGLSMNDSLAHVSRESYFAHRDLATELLIVRRQAEMTSFELAFRQFAQRIDVQEVQSLSALITQNQRLGTDVVSSVRDFTDSLRLKWRQINDERAARASVALIFPLVLCLLPSIFILLWGPAVAQILEFVNKTFPGLRRH